MKCAALAGSVRQGAIAPCGAPLPPEPGRNPVLRGFAVKRLCSRCGLPGSSPSKAMFCAPGAYAGSFTRAYSEPLGLATTDVPITPVLQLLVELFDEQIQPPRILSAVVVSPPAYHCARRGRVRDDIAIRCASALARLGGRSPPPMPVLSVGPIGCITSRCMLHHFALQSDDRGLGMPPPALRRATAEQSATQFRPVSSRLPLSGTLACSWLAAATAPCWASATPSISARCDESNFVS